jgi:hypothetical protein
MRTVAWRLVTMALALAAVACSETVGFLDINLLVPDRSPAIVCKDDPRRVVKISARATCDGEAIERSAVVQPGADGSFSVMGVPLGRCTLEVTAINAHDRVVLSGKVSGPVSAGENAPVDLQLVEERCETADCDGDGDGLADTDEKAIGTSAESLDTDGDGLEDGLELYQCCTDPMKPEGQCRELLIQRVEPGMGPVGSTVLVKASAPLEQPDVAVGGLPLQNLFADSTIALGSVAPGAALGEVQLTSGGGKVSYQHLFAVLHDPAQILPELSNKASGSAPAMYQLVDETFDGTRQYLLGRSFAKTGTTGEGTSKVVPVLLQLDHERATAFKTVVAGSGEPVAVSAAAGRVLVLLSSAGRAQLVLYTPPKLTPNLGPPRQVALPDPNQAALLDAPVALELETTGDTAQLLLRDRIARIKFDSDGKAGAVQALPLGPVSCVGMAIQGNNSASGANARGATFISCNAQGPCPPGGTCDAVGQLLRLPPDCLDFSSNVNPGAASGPSCGSVHMLVDPRPLVGNPVVDPGRGRLYALGAGGVVATDLANPAQLVPTLVPFKWAGSVTTGDVMAAAGSHLFVVDGPQIWRMEPGSADASRRRGKSFPVSRGTDEAQLVAASADGTALGISVRHTGGFDWIANICLSPCGK